MGGSSELPLPSLLMFRPLLPNEDPEVSYEPTTDFTSTMVEFQTRN
jgi:hypothetical protein